MMLDLKEFRNRNGLRQKDIADTLGVTVQRISVAENGKGLTDGQINILWDDPRQFVFPEGFAPSDGHSRAENKLKVFRTDNGLTQAQLALFLGIRKSYLSLMENGHERLNDRKIQKILDNDRGWDVSAFTGQKPDKVIRKSEVLSSRELLEEMTVLLRKISGQLDELNEKLGKS